MRIFTFSFKSLLVACLLMGGASSAWAETVDLKSRTTPNNELFFHCKAFGVTYGGTVSQGYSSTDGWGLTNNYNTRKLQIDTNTPLAQGDVISIEFKTDGSNSNVMNIYLEDNSSAEAIVNLTKSGMAKDGIFTIDYTIPESSPLIGNTTFLLGKSGNNKYVRKVIITRSDADDLRPNTLTGTSKSWNFEGFNTVTTTEDIVNDDLFYKTGVKLDARTSGIYQQAVELATDKYLTFWIPAGTGKVELICSSGNDRYIRAKVGSEEVVTLGSVNFAQKIYTFGYSVTEATPITLSGNGTGRCYVHAVNVCMGYETVSLNATYPYASYSCVNDIDVDNITASSGAVTVYKASSVDGDNVTLEPVTGKVPAGTGLILKGTSGATITIPYTTGAGALDDNLLKPLDQSGSLTSTAEPDGTATTGTNYVLTVQDSKVVFAPIGVNPATMKAGQAYLNAPGSLVKALSIVIDGETTGVDALESADTDEEEVLYNIAGIKVDKNFKGIVINQKGVKRFNK